MKRFISYLLLCFSILLSVFVCFDRVFYNVNTSSDFGDGAEFIYQIKVKDSEDYINKNGNFVTEDIELEKEIDDVIDQMKSRLDKADVTKAVVEKMESANKENDNGYYTVRVAYKAQYEQMYGIINEFLTFDRNLSVSIIAKADGVSNFEQFDDKGDEKLFKLGKAELIDAVNPHSQNVEELFPVIKLPLANPQEFNDQIFKIVKAEENQDDTKGLIRPHYEEGAEEGGEPEETPKDKYIYVVNNWKGSYDIEKATGEGEYLTEARQNIVYAFDTTNPASMFYNYKSGENDVNDALKLTVNQYAPDVSQVKDPAVVQRIVTMCANIELAKLNSNPYRVDIKLLNESYPTAAETNKVPAFVEGISEHGKLVVTSLTIATIAAFVLIALFMALNYGINALTGMTIGSAVALSSAGLLSLFGVEFNIGTVVALLVVAIASIFSSAIYFKAVRESCYTGKNLKKANTEASKKTIMYHLDISIVMIILGVVGYVRTNSVLMSIGAILICGGIFNFLFSAIVLRGLSWLLANSSFIEKHIGLLKIEKKFIPDLLNDEKPVYFDSFKSIKSNKKRNIVVAAVTGALLLGSVIAIPVVNSTTGDLYGKAPETTLNSQIHVSYTVKSDDDSTKEFRDTLNEILGKVYTITEKDGKKYVGHKLGYEPSEVKRMYYSLVNKDGNTDQTYTYIISLDSVVKADKLYTYNDGSDDNFKEGAELTTAEANIETIIGDEIREHISDPKVHLMNVKNCSDDNLNYNILIYTLIALSIITGYILLRFGLGKALISLVIVGGISTISVGVFSMLQVGLTSANTLAVIIIALVGYAVLLHYYNRERDVIKENRAKIKDADSRKEYVRLSSNLSFATALTAIALGFLAIVSFLLSKSFSQGIVLISALGVLLLILACQALIVPMDEINKLLWNKTKTVCNLDKIHFKKHKGDNKTKKKHSDGPQEATFIGIND